MNLFSNIYKMILYKVIYNNGKEMLMTKSHTFPYLKDKLFLEGVMFDEIKGAKKGEKKYNVGGQCMLNVHAIDDIIPIEYKGADEEFIECITDQETLEKRKKLDCNDEDHSGKTVSDEEFNELEEYYKKNKKHDDYDDEINYADTI